jgi:hypothetical protein
MTRRPAQSTFPKPKGKASETGQKAADMVDEKRAGGAGGPDSASASLRSRADSLPGGEKVGNAAHTAADAVGTAADYVRHNDLKGMLADMQQIVKNHPGPALLTAAALGFLIARTISRN